MTEITDRIYQHLASIKQAAYRQESITYENLKRDLLELEFAPIKHKKQHIDAIKQELKEIHEIRYGHQDETQINEELDKLGDRLDTLRNIAIEMRGELQTQEVLIDDLDRSVDTQSSRLQILSRKIHGFTKEETRGCYICCLLVILLVIVGIIIGLVV